MICFLHSISCSLHCFFAMLKIPLRQAIRYCCWLVYVSRYDCHFGYCLYSRFLQRTIFRYLSVSLSLFPFSGDYHPTLYRASSTLTHSFILPLPHNATFQSTQMWKFLVRRRKLYWFAWMSSDVDKYVVLTEQTRQCTHSLFFLAPSLAFV